MTDEQFEVYMQEKQKQTAIMAGRLEVAIIHAGAAVDRSKNVNAFKNGQYAKLSKIQTEVARLLNA